VDLQPIPQPVHDLEAFFHLARNLLPMQTEAIHLTQHLGVSGSGRLPHHVPKLLHGPVHLTGAVVGRLRHAPEPLLIPELFGVARGELGILMDPFHGLRHLALHVLGPLLNPGHPLHAVVQLLHLHLHHLLLLLLLLLLDHSARLLSHGHRWQKAQRRTQEQRSSRTHDVA
jgi:hypothetical protein